MKKIESEKRLQDLFPAHAKPELLAERETVPPDVVTKVAQFVLDFERASQTGALHSEILAQAIEDYADAWIKKVEDMKITLKQMDYHEGLRYRPDVAKHVQDLAIHCRSLYDFCSADAHTTRQTSPDLRRVFAHYRSEMKSTMPRVLDKIALADQTYNLEQMSRYVRPLFY
jgi:deoxyribodipyrimidine photolyase